MKEKDTFSIATGFSLWVENEQFFSLNPPAKA